MYNIMSKSIHTILYLLLRTRIALMFAYNPKLLHCSKIIYSSNILKLAVTGINFNCFDLSKVQNRGMYR